MCFHLHGISHPVNVTCSSAIVYISESISPSEQGPCMGGATSLCRYFHAPSYPLIFTWELHVDAKSTQYTELTVLSPSMFWHVEGQDPPIHKRGVGIKRTGEEIEASYHSGLLAVGCPTAFEVYSKSQLLPSCS